MLPFANDYMQTMHPALLKRLASMEGDAFSGYGSDACTESAKARIRAAFSCPEADVVFLCGGTQANLVVISAMLHATEGVVAATTGHVAVHEAGAIEATGHKVLTLPSHEGKVCAEELAALLCAFDADETREHTVYPGMLYISHPTEYGTLYTKAELQALSDVCHAHGMPLYLDGARLGYGLAAHATDVHAADIAALCDAFTIGGTKVGAICGEAVVFPGGAPKHFFSYVKQRGALMAKGFFVGAQFDTLFTDGLYEAIGRHAIDMVERLCTVLAQNGYERFMESPTNQQFVILEPRQYEFLSEQVHMSVWEPLADGRIVVRFCTSWATTEEQIDALAYLLAEAKRR